MIASTLDLPMRGNYFAEDAYLTQDLGAGTMHNRAGAHVVTVTDDFLLAVLNTLEADEIAARLGGDVRTLGRDWGQRAGEQFAAEMEKHHGRPVAELPLALVAADLTEAFRHHGWGDFRFDFGRYAQGLIGVDVREPIIGSVVKSGGRPADALLAAFLAGMFSQFAGLELDCLQTESWSNGVARGRFLLTVPERLASVSDGGSHDEVVAELSKNA